MLTDGEIASFMRDGFVVVRGAVPRPVVDACVDVVWEELEGRGVRRADAGSWKAPVERIVCPEEGEPAFAEAGTAGVLWEAYDQLIGPDKWWKREGMGGTIPVRFPHPADPGDAGWHIETSYWDGTDWRANIRSRERGLLSLFLLTDVGADDAPTRIRVGSHADAARVLAPAGDDGLTMAESGPPIVEASADRRVVEATGSAGDVYLCHPFLVHAASWPHRGISPRIITQPGVALLEPFTLTDPTAAHPVEAAILAAISG
ncbi:phytanoyl-CoA dioxygenase family protein [Kribbella albertanoniae]|uniref:Phytanoyl-CoA dioxygenase n=1 Tax=Kribbella albertanoniae TaxID=1266829 RepID=A0A4R4P3T2_9ACTN|nr:phytanoyl-CoA dioxygenase family protein [Kribbella albertanoniae]TDC14652.1 phytanoyl-CoA dioxygenase [Kribbella albertanoniae]